MSHAKAGGDFLLTPYVIHRLVSLAQRREGAAETGQLGRSRKEQGPKRETARGRVKQILTSLGWKDESGASQS